jgi:hypothetical protein
MAVKKKKKKKVKEKIKEGVREIKKKVAELEQLEEALDEIEGNIFDEDLDHVEEPDEVSDFDIGTTMLTAAPAVESWAGQNLEDELNRSWIEKDWKADDEVATGEVYDADSKGGDSYGTSVSDSYSSGERGDGVYGSSSDDLYKKGEGSDGSYGAKGGSVETKVYSQDDHRGKRSMLEVTGFEDMKKKQHKKFTREFSVYEAKGKG